MIKINLIPPEVLAEQAKKLRILQATLAAGCFALLIAMVSLWRWDTQHNLVSERDQLKAELNKVNEKVKQVEAFEAILAQVQSHLDVINNLLKGRLVNPYFMEDFARALTGGVWVTSINSTQDGNALKLQIDAKALDKNEIADWMRSLESYGNTVNSAETIPAPVPARPGAKEPPKPPNRFSNIELGSIQQTNEGGTLVYTFSLSCSYQNPKL